MLLLVELSARHSLSRSNPAHSSVDSLHKSMQQSFFFFATSSFY
jgi:hypothetical protein